MELRTVTPEIREQDYLEFFFEARDERETRSGAESSGGGPCAGRARPRAVLSLRNQGDMKFDADKINPFRERFFSRLGIEAERVRPLRLLHTRRVVRASAQEGSEALRARAAALGGADGLIAGDAFPVLALTVADCMPLWLYDAATGAMGLLHSGWKGTGILEAALSGMAGEFGSAPADLCVILGPSIGACCYTVPEERARSFAAEFGADAVRIEQEAGGETAYRLDLRAANIALAARLGIGRLVDIDLCTSCSPALGSFRRQGPSGFTRMLALCGFF